MLTYQDLLKIEQTDDAKRAFVSSAINAHKQSDIYKTAEVADLYDKKQNKTIMNYQKLLYTISGVAVPDNFSANYKLCSNFFNRFVTQQSQYLLGNGLSLSDNNQKEMLGKDFDTRLQELGRNALVDGVSFGFWNYDHLEVFRVKEFVPLYDEENGALMAGIRFWQIDKTKPLRATLFELDGYTDYIWNADNVNGGVLNEKRPYILTFHTSEADGTKIYDGENYPSFPIVPLWGNPAHQSELVGIQEQIDAYDLIKSGFANDLDDTSQIYWTIQNAGGMDDIDLARFVERMKTVKAAVVDDAGARAEAHTMDVPYASREALLTRLRSDLYEDFMALDTKNIANGATTATQIKAAYEPINNKTDMYEYCVLDFLDNLFLLVGIENADPSFTRSIIVNVQENMQLLLQGAEYLTEDYVTQKILELFGDGDRTEDILKEKEREDRDRMPVGNEDNSGNKEEEDNNPPAEEV